MAPGQVIRQTGKTEREAAAARTATAPPPVHPRLALPHEVLCGVEALPRLRIGFEKAADGEEEQGEEEEEVRLRLMRLLAHMGGF